MNFRTKHIRYTILILLTFLCLHSNVAGQRMKFGRDIEITVLPMLSGNSSHGYIEYSFSIQNRSMSATHTVEIKMPDYSSYNRYNDAIQIRKRVTVSQGTTAIIKIYQPFIALNSSQAQVIVDGMPQKNRLNLVRANINEYTAPCILHSKQIPSSLINEFETQFKATAILTYMAHEDIELARLEISPEQWPTNELAYSRYDAILLTNEDMDKLSQKVKDCLVRYTELGGNLIITDSTFIPQQWKPYQTKSKKELQVGFGKLFSITLPKNHKQPKTFKVGSSGKLTNTAFSSLDLKPIINSIASLYEKFKDDAHYGYNNNQYNKAFPVVDGMGIPVRTLFFVMLAFALVIGPLNIIYLIKKKKRIMLLVTVPVISILFTVVLTATAFISEGFQGTSRTSTFTILDQSSKRSTTMGVTAYYSPITPWNGLQFDSNTELNLCKLGNGYSAENHEMDQTNGQSLKSGWISARIPTHFRIRKSEIRRERINFSKSDSEDVIALNGFSCDLKTLYYADMNGVLYKAESIQAGQKKSLLKIKGKYKAATDLRSFSAIYKDGLFKEIVVGDSIVEMLVPNSYIAVMNASPFVEKALEDCKEVKHRSLVYGFVGGDK